MDTIRLPPDFKEFLKLLNQYEVRYLLVGGYAVSYHGYPRTTADMDIWVGIDKDNAQNVLEVINAFGLEHPDLTHLVFMEPDRIFRMGYPPLRIEVLTGISGVQFDECHANRVQDQIDGVSIQIISLQDLKTNKRAASRHKDLDDLEHLP